MYDNTYLANSNEFAVRSWQTADIFLLSTYEKYKSSDKSLSLKTSFYR